MRDRPPREGHGDFHGFFLRDRPRGLEPVPRSELAGTDKTDRKDARAVRIESGILTHQVEHGVDAGFGGLFDACLDLRFAHDVGLEHQAEAWESLSTKSKNAWTAARTRCLLSVVDRRAWRTPEMRLST